MNSELKAKEIYEYMVSQLAEGVSIDKTREKEMIEEINFMIDTD